MLIGENAPPYFNRGCTSVLRKVREDELGFWLKRVTAIETTAGHSTLSPDPCLRDFSSSLTTEKPKFALKMGVYGKS
jgi:hypothetical protein